MLTTIRVWCREFIAREYPAESHLFDVVWDSIGQFPGPAPAASGRLVVPPDAGVAFDGEGGIELRSTWIAFVVPSVLGQLGTKLQPSYSEVEQAVLSCSRAFGASEPIARELADRLSRSLCDTFDRLAAEYRQTVGATSSRLALGATRWVEWCDQRYDSHQAPLVTTRCLTANDCMESLEHRKDSFWLYIDEQLGGIIVRGKSIRGRRQPRLIPWDRLPGREQRLLGLFLASFRDRQPVRYATIASKVLDDDLKRNSGTEERIRALKSRLDSNLQGVVGEVVVAEKGEYRYVPRGLIPYCWIRLDRESSRLWSAPPR